MNDGKVLGLRTQTEDPGEQRNRPYWKVLLCAGAKHFAKPSYVGLGLSDWIALRLKSIDQQRLSVEVNRRRSFNRLSACLGFDNEDATAR